MSATGTANSNGKAVCCIPLCGKEADWRVDMFGKPEFYCERHRPGVPEKFMEHLNAS